MQASFYLSVYSLSAQDVYSYPILTYRSFLMLKGHVEANKLKQGSSFTAETDIVYKAAKNCAVTFSFIKVLKDQKVLFYLPILFLFFYFFLPWMALTKSWYICLLYFIVSHLQKVFI